MKKVSNKWFLALVVLIFFENGIFAQSNPKNANRSTAIRCLKLAESSLAGEDWDNALKQADLGLSYDENISDLLYIKAVAEINFGKSKAEVLKILNSAFEKNDWVSYSKNGARIFLSDLLCDTGLYEESLKILDSEPFIFSADSEYIRIKNYYRMGTTQSINDARLKLNTSRRIYPDDERFPNIFFMFETFYLNESEKKGIEYEIPEIVKTISSAYISKLPDYSGSNTQLEIMASYFADENTKNRLIKAIDSKEQTIHPLLAVAGLKIGLYSEQQAFDLFFDSFVNTISLDMLENFANQIKSTEVQQKLIEKLSDYSGIIIIDENCDLQNEIEVSYENGRPTYIKYDKNNDGQSDLYSSCDLGAPLYVYYYENKSEIYYEGFPKVKKVNFMEDNCILNFIHDDFKYYPYKLEKNSYFEKYGIDFYVPIFDENVFVPNIEEFALHASSLELPVLERENANVIFTIEQNQLVFANYYSNNRKYASCDFTTGLPYIRYVDNDDDGKYETIEEYDSFPVAEGFDFEKEKKLVQSVFSKVIASQELYLKKISIDQNGNTYFEYSEQFFEYNGRLSFWDTDDDGVCNCQYIRYPQKEGESLVEETIYFEENGLQKILVKSIDCFPVTIRLDDLEESIYAGVNENLFWINEEGTFEQEKAILEYINNGVPQGVVDIVQTNENRISVIKINKNIFCKILPPSEIIEIEDNVEEIED